MSNRIQFRRDTKANWASVNPILMEGEIGLETDTLNAKIGDGVNSWNSLDYAKVIDNLASSPGSSENLAMSQKAVTELFYGTSENSSADKFPQISITDFSIGVTETDNTKRSETIMSNFNAWLDAINFKSDGNCRKYYGLCKIGCDGRNGEVNNYIMSYKDDVGVQVVHGSFAISTSDASKLSYANDYAVLKRRRENGVWGNWSEY